MKKYRVALFALVAIALVTLTVLVTGFHNFKKQLERYANVPILGNKDEVLYRLGHPSEVLGPLEKVKGLGEGGWQPVYYTDPKLRDSDPKNAMPSDKHVKDYNDWVYPINNNETQAVTVTFDGRSNSIETITCMDDSLARAASPCTPLLGIAIDATEEDVLQKMGHHHYRYKLDGVSKWLWYDDVGVEFGLTKGKVYMIKLHHAHGDDTAMFMRYLRTVLP